MFELLTYGQIADRLGIRQAAAEARVRRQKWRKIRGNDGRLKIEVPTSALTLRDPTPTLREPDMSAPTPMAYVGLPDPTLPPTADPALVELRARAERAESVVADLRQRVAELEAERQLLVDRVTHGAIKAAKAEGEAIALRDALADLSRRLDDAMAEARRSWWRKLFG